VSFLDPGFRQTMSYQMWLSIRRQATIAALSYRHYPHEQEMLEEVGLTRRDLVGFSRDGRP